MHRATRPLLSLLALSLAACSVAVESGDDDTASTAEPIVAPPAGGGRGPVRMLSRSAAEARAPSNAARTVADQSTTISYHGGDVLTNGVNVYYIWYGDWSGNTATTILTDFASNLGGSSWYAINTTYADATTFVQNKVTYAGSTTDAYSQGKSLTDAQVGAVVAQAIGSGALPADAEAVYFVLTSVDVGTTTGFCSSYCGFHNHKSVGGVDIKYAFVGNADRCLDGCAPQKSSPNGNAGADAMASVVAHELVEAVTDPDLDGWYNGGENADQCAWTFGTTYQPTAGVQANMRLGGRDYLIQQNWANLGLGYCATTYGSAPPYGSTISLTARADGQYVTAENGGASPLVANRAVVGPWERFQLVDQGYGFVAIKALVNGDYVSAENGGASALIANRTAVGKWETFYYIDLGNRHFALRALANNKYVTAENGGASALIANRTTIGPWEIFRWDLQQ
jgi:hypothetical protein